jgi:uncharacterized protein (DUF849 family)
MADKVFITAALTGAWATKEMNEHLPITPSEIAEDAYQCWKAGAAIVHLHMRDDEGEGTMDPAKYAETIKLIRAHKDCDVIINCTSSGSKIPLNDEQRMTHFRENSEIQMGSYDAGTMNWGCHVVFENSPSFLEKLGNCYNENSIRPELEIFDVGMLGNVNHYVKKGILKDPLCIQFVLGVLGGMDATVDNLMHLVRVKPEGAKWSAFGIGKEHLPIMYAALALGADGVRVGLEDNLMYSRNVKATNVSLVERAVKVIKNFDKQIATPAETREILGLKK